MHPLHKNQFTSDIKRDKYPRMALKFCQRSTELSIQRKVLKNEQFMTNIQSFDCTFNRIVVLGIDLHPAFRRGEGGVSTGDAAPAQVNE